MLADVGMVGVVDGRMLNSKTVSDSKLASIDLTMVEGFG